VITTSAEIVIDAPKEAVWRVVTDVNSYSEWNPLIPSAQGEPAVGASIEMLICPPGLMRRRARVEVLALIPEREFRWLGRWGFPRILDGDHSFLVEALDAGRTRVTQTETFSGVLAGPLAAILVPRMRQGFEAMNHALKARCERRSS